METDGMKRKDLDPWDGFKIAQSKSWDGMETKQEDKKIVWDESHEKTLSALAREQNTHEDGDGLDILDNLVPVRVTRIQGFKVSRAPIVSGTRRSGVSGKTELSLVDKAWLIGAYWLVGLIITFAIFFSLPEYNLLGRAWTLILGLGGLSFVFVVILAIRHGLAEEAADRERRLSRKEARSRMSPQERKLDELQEKVEDMESKQARVNKAHGWSIFWLWWYK